MTCCDKPLGERLEKMLFGLKIPGYVATEKAGKCPNDSKYPVVSSIRTLSLCAWQPSHLAATPASTTPTSAQIQVV